MSIPGSNTATKPQTTSPSKPKFLGFGSQEPFEEPTTGEKIAAVCVERVFDELPEYSDGKLTGKTKLNLILVFELEETMKDGTRFTRTLKGWPGFSKGKNSEKSTWNKHLRTWAGSNEPLNEQQQTEWMAAINGKSDFENDYIDPHPPIVGVNCQLLLEHNEKGTYVNIEKVYPPKEDQTLTISEHYKPYFERKAEKEAKSSGSSNVRRETASPKGSGSVPF